MKKGFNAQKIGAWIAFFIGAIYFLVPLIGTFEFSLRMRRGEYSFDAYRVVFSDPNFQATFSYSIVLGILTIIFGVLLVVSAPAASAPIDRVYHLDAAGYSGHRHRVRLSAHL